MKKRILSILLLCCMVLTLLPTTAFAAETGAMDTIPAKFDVEIDLCGRTKDININDSKTYYIYSSSSDPDFVWTKKIQINGKKAAPHIFLDNVNIQVKKDAKTPAIELHGKASAYLYFINRDSKLTGATGRAAIQKNRSEGQLCVQVMEGTTVTCQGGYKAAGIGGSWATRNIAESLFNLDMYGHGANMHFGSQTNPSLWSGTIIAKGGDGGAGIGGGRNGSGEKLYFYSGKIEAKGGEAASGIGGSFKGRGRDIYIYGGDISAKGGDGGAGIGGGCWKSLQDMDGDTAAYNINIYGGKINAHGGYNGAGIGGGQYVPARDITITGGEITAHGTHGAAIGGGRWCHGQNITVTDAKLKLTTGYSRYISDEAAAMGYGDRVYLEKVYDIDVGKRYIGDLVRNPLPEDYKSIKIGSYHGKLVKLKVEAQAINRDDEFALFWNLYDILIPNENGRIDVQLLTLPYVKNYGWAIEAMEMELIDDPCNGKHDFGWVDRQSCHVWACRNMKCQARDPVAEMSKQNGKHIPGDWGNQKQLCTVCGHVIGTDTKAPVLEVLKDGESYTVEDNINGNPGAYTFTVSDPAASGEASSGIKSVTINGKEQTGPTYRLPAPDGGNNDAGNEYTVVATDNAGNETTATVRTYRRHHVKVISPDGKKTYADLMLPHNEYLVLQIRLPAGVSATLTDQADGTEIPYDKENGEFRAGLITKSRTLVLNYSTKHPKVELRLGTGQYFTGYNADSDEPYYLKGASMDENSYQIGMWVDTDAKPGYYLSSPERYTQEDLAALDESLWKEYKIAEATPGSIVLPFILITIDAAAYEENGGWYVYAKATNPTGTTYVSTPKMIIDVENPKAIDFSTGKELVSNGKYWGDLRFTVEDSSPVTVRHYTSPGGTAELLTPDEKGVYTISAEYDGSTQHMLVIEDACGNTTSYKSFKVCWNYLINVREKDHWDAPPAQPIRISREQNLKEELSKVQIGVFAADTSGFIPVDVSWKIPDDYDPQSRREQTFTVLGTVVLKGTGARCPSGLDVVPRPGEEWKKNISVQVTVEGEPQYKVTVQDCENGRVKVVNAAGTAEDGTPLFCKDELVMLSIAPDEGYMLSTLSVNGTPAAVAVGEDTYTFAQPEEDVTITATFEKRNEHTVTFDANGGSEPEELPEEVTTAMPAKKILHGSEYSLPECEFIAPEGKQFKAWEIDGAEYPVNAPVTVTADITVKALWEDAPPAPAEFTITVKTDGNGTASASPAKAVAGEEITLTATPKEDYRFKEWQVVSPAGLVITNNKFTMPDSNVEVKAIFEEDAPPVPTEFTITVTSGGNGTASASHAKAVAGTEIRLTATPKTGYHFKEWEVISGGVTIKDDKFLMPNDNVEVKAIFEKDAPPAPTDPAKPSISVTGTYTYNGSEHTATVSGYNPATMDISGNTATAAGDYTVSVTSQTGKWADGSTDAVTAAWSIGKATQEAPTGLIGVAPTTEGGSDGKISGVTDKMEYRMAGESSYTACSGTEIDNLSAGNYFVRYAEDNNHFASSDTVVTVGEGASLADCTITFNAGAGSGSMDSVTVKAGANYILPECGFTAPADQEFQAWEIGGTEYKVGDFYTVRGDTEIKALWENSVITPTTYTVTVSNDGKGTGTATPSTAAAGTMISLTATPNEGYHFKEWQVISGGVTIKDDKFTMPSANVEVKAIFEKDAPPAPTEYTITVTSGDNGTASASHAKAVVGTEIRLTATPNTGYHLKEWQVISGGVTIKDDKFTMPSANVEVKAIFEKDTGGGGGGYNPPVTYYTLRFETGGGSDIPSVQGTYNTYIDLTKYVPTWRGHTFIGWYSERSLMNKVSGVYLTKDMTVYAGWRVDENPGTGANPFTDVSEKDWFYGDVMFVYENGLMLGTSKTLFSPYGTATRGMMATILWRMEGSPAPKGKNSFTDVEAGKWYADAITWTAENGIFAGYGKDKFGPDDPITREQLAAIFYRYADYKGYDLTVKGNLDKFKDADKITDYAKTAMQWAVGSSLVKGKSGNLLDPQGTATRAEIAAMLHRFIEKYELVQGKAPGGLMGWIDPKRLQIPKTGDSSVLGLWGISLCTSLAGCLALTTWQIRRRREEESLQIIEK